MDIVYKGAVIAGGVGTAALAAYAYFGEGLRKRRNSPILNASIAGKGEGLYLSSEDEAGHRFRVTIENNRPATEAKGVRVRLLSLYREIPKNYSKWVPPAPLHIKWAAPPNDSQPYLSNFTTFDVIELGYQRRSPNEIILQTIPVTHAFDSTISEGQNALMELEVSGENVPKPKLYYFELNWAEFKDKSGKVFSRVPFITQRSQKEFKQLTTS